MSKADPNQPAHPLSQTGGCFVIEAGELLPAPDPIPDAQPTEIAPAQSTPKKAVKPAVKEA
jgi:hypothetical protein